MIWGQKIGMFWQLHPFYWLHKRNKPQTQLRSFFLCFNPGFVLYDHYNWFGILTTIIDLSGIKPKKLNFAPLIFEKLAIVAKIIDKTWIYRLAWCQWSVRFQQICNFPKEEDDYDTNVTHIYSNICISGKEYWKFKYKLSIFRIKIYSIFIFGQIIRNE